jgi:hypothetical protein
VTLEAAKAIFDIFDHAAAGMAIVAAAWWFWRTARNQQRIAFDIDCTFLDIGEPDVRIAQICFIFENRGFVEHKLWDLQFYLDALHGPPERKPSTYEVIFPQKVYSRVNIVPKRYGYFFVRPGVRQPVVHIVTIPKDLALVRVTAGFTYGRNAEYPHTIRRLFEVPK